VSASGAERVLHDFAGYPNDGQAPFGLTLLNGEFYGSTEAGGSTLCSVSGYSGCGSIYKMSLAGQEQVIYNCADDIVAPSSSLVAVHGALYGMALRYNGVMYRVSTSGKAVDLYGFKGYPGDGAAPGAALLLVKGVMYGTTTRGGRAKFGTVFSITTAGKETELYSFLRHPDASDPAAGLIEVKGTLYGTTEQGGTGRCKHNKHIVGCGTVFEISTTGAEHVIYSFQGKSDGESPDAGLIAVGGKLYGTTSAGGAYGAGTVFAVGTDGVESVLHSFGYDTDGAGPSAGLIDVKGTLYGSTTSGGGYGDGTIFALALSG